MPFILRFPEGGCVNRAGEAALSRTVVEREVDLVWLVMVLVDDHQCPVAIGTLHRVRRYQHVSIAVLYVAGGLEEFVSGAPQHHQRQATWPDRSVRRSAGLYRSTERSVFSSRLDARLQGQNSNITRVKKDESILSGKIRVK